MPCTPTLLSILAAQQHSLSTHEHPDQDPDQDPENALFETPLRCRVTAIAQIVHICCCGYQLAMVPWPEGADWRGVSHNWASK